MNIFFLHNDPVKCAEYMVDRHVVKMILETAQILSTAHRFLDGHKTITFYNNRKHTIWKLDDVRENVLHKATHINHPSTVWARQTNNNYNWLYCHFLALLQEYEHRYRKNHACNKLVDVLRNPPRNIEIGYLQKFAIAMAPEFVISDDPITNYRNYYKHGKAKLHVWKNREIPFFIK